MADKTQLFKERLSFVRTQLKAPKGQYNSFGKYHYRSTEDIVEAVKPLLAAYQLTLSLTDELVHAGDRYYIKAVAIIEDLLSDEFASSQAFAREEETKKGMDGSQITGTASSYARKYALNGLLNIDDTKDADATNDHEKPQNSAQGTRSAKPKQGAPTTSKPPTTQKSSPRSEIEQSITDNLGADVVATIDSGYSIDAEGVTKHIKDISKKNFVRAEDVGKKLQSLMGKSSKDYTANDFAKAHEHLSEMMFSETII